MSANILDPSMTFNAALTKICGDAGECLAAAASKAIKLKLLQLWYQQLLQMRTTEALEIYFTALSVASGHQVTAPSTDSETMADVFSKQLESWEQRAAECAAELKALLRDEANRAAKFDACRYLEQKIEGHGKQMSYAEDANFASLVKCLFGLEADQAYGSSDSTAVAAPPAGVDPEECYQVDLVTLVKFVGGEPHVTKTVYIPKSMGWSDVFKLFAKETKNFQVAMLGYVNGLSSTDGGGWFCQVFKDSTPTSQPFRMVSILGLSQLKSTISQLGPGERVRVIHVSRSFPQRVVEF